MAACVYDGIDLGSYLLTKTINQGPVKDPTSGVDVLGSEILIHLRTMLYYGSAASLPGESAPATLVRIKDRLCNPRRPFFFSVGGVTMINLTAGPDGTALDDQNGPMPIQSAVTVTEITAGAFAVTWAVRVMLVQCANATARGYLSLRWSEGVTQDRDQLTTKRRTGTLIVSSRGPDPDTLRGLVTPGVDPGFVRQSWGYEVSTDGLTYRFNFTDREVHRAPPYPAIRMEGGQAETMPLYGGMRMGQLHLKLYGRKGTDTRQLLTTGVRVGMARVFASKPLTGRTGKILIGGHVEEGIGDSDCWVGVRLEWIIKPKKTREKPADAGRARNAIIGAVFGTPFGLLGQITGGVIGANIPSPPAGGSVQNETDNKGRDRAAAAGDFASWVGSPIPGADPAGGVYTATRGTAGVALVAAALNDPCGSTVRLLGPGGDGGGNQLVGATTGGTLTVTSAGGVQGTVTTNAASDPASEDEDALFAEDNDDGVYDKWECVFHYRYVTGETVLPGTGVGADGDTGVRVTLHGKTMTCTVQLYAAKTGGGPIVLPDLLPTDPNLVLQEATPSVEELDLAADGVSIVRRLAASAVFGVLDPRKCRIVAPVPPWLDKSGVKDEALRPFVFRRGLVATDDPQGGNPFFLDTLPTDTEDPAFPNPFSGQFGAWGWGGFPPVGP